MSRSRSLLAAAASALAAAFAGDSAFAQTSPPPPACAGAEFHAFDFWIGDWAVSNAQTGAASGENLIAFAHDGCAIREQWSGADGVRGESVTYYDPIDGKWRQRWVSSGYGGYALELEGVAEEAGRMTLSGAAHFYARKQAVDMRITWKADGDARLIQTFETRSPETGEWKTWFEGRYVRK